MGVDLSGIITPKEIEIRSLTDKIIGVDAHNTLYQFLSIIRGPDGEPLKNRKGQVTSHLSGIFYRTCKLLSEGVKLVYVFDGKPHPLKFKTIGIRKEAREEAAIRYKEAIEVGDLVSARKYAQASTKLDFYIIETAKELLKRLGVPAIQAPGEGEAQAAHMTRIGLFYATASQDYDVLLFGATRLVRNLAITGRRKLPNKNAYVEVNPEIVELDCVLNENGISWEQLINIGLLVGTDFMPGIKGVGAKKALKLIKKGMSIEEIYTLHGESKPPEFEEVFNIFFKPHVEVHEIVFGNIDAESVIEFLVSEHDFSEDRVQKALEPVIKNKEREDAKGGLLKWMS